MTKPNPKAKPRTFNFGSASVQRGAVTLRRFSWQEPLPQQPTEPSEDAPGTGG